MELYRGYQAAAVCSEYSESFLESDVIALEVAAKKLESSIGDIEANGAAWSAVGNIDGQTRTMFVSNYSQASEMCGGLRSLLGSSINDNTSIPNKPF